MPRSIGSTLRAATILIASAVVAAATCQPAANAAEPQPPAHSWSGCHAGAQAGWIKDQTSLAFSPAGAFVTFLGQTAVDAFTQHYRFDDSGFTIGGHFGCDYQSGFWVGGVEADLNWTNLKTDIDVSYPVLTAPGGQTFLPHTDRLSNRLNWYSTVRGRLGFAADRLLVYATGGLAVAKIETTSQLYNAAGLLSYNGREESIRTGWTMGAGAEYALLPNWLLRAEYLYLDFGSFTYDSVTSPTSVFVFANDVDTSFHVVRAGFTYQFDGLVRR